MKSSGVRLRKATHAWLADGDTLIVKYLVWYSDTQNLEHTEFELFKGADIALELDRNEDAATLVVMAIEAAIANGDVPVEARPIFSGVFNDTKRKEAHGSK